MADNDGFSPAEIKQLIGELERVKTAFYDKINKEVGPMKEAMEKNQDALDRLICESARKGRYTGRSTTTFAEAFANEIEQQFQSKQAEIKNFQTDKSAKISFEMKMVGDMFSSQNITGDGQASYGSRQGLVPGQRINFRDLIPAVNSPTGIYVSYRETGGEGAIGIAAETSQKPQVDYDFTEVKTVSGYIAGWARFSKQMMFNLPWLQNTLSRMLLRDFYKKENAIFYATVAANATGFNDTLETEDAKALIDVLMGRLDNDFNNSFILVRNQEKGRLLKLLYENGFYMGAGSVIGAPDGTIRIADTPVIGVSWATDDKIMIIDNDFLERVQTESLRIDFSYEDANNFTQNRVTARIECFEELNALRWDAHSYLDMGNESS